MTVLKPTTEPQDVSVQVRPHSPSTYTIILRDKEQRTETTQQVSGVLDNGRLYFTISEDFRDSAFYYIRVLTNGGTANGDYASNDYSSADYFVGSLVSEEEIYRGTIYTTTQTDLEKYIAVTNYEEATQDKNDFIVYTG